MSLLFIFLASTWAFEDAKVVFQLVGVVFIVADRVTNNGPSGAQNFLFLLLVVL